MHFAPHWKGSIWSPRGQRDKPSRNELHLLQVHHDQYTALQRPFTVSFSYTLSLSSFVLFLTLPSSSILCWRKRGYGIEKDSWSELNHFDAQERWMQILLPCGYRMQRPTDPLQKLCCSHDLIYVYLVTSRNRRMSWKTRRVVTFCRRSSRRWSIV